MGRKRIWRRPAVPETLLDVTTTLGPLLPAANVIMQLSDPAVGYGVLESRATGGTVRTRPFKRARTTATYLAVALFGTEQEIAHSRTAIRAIHRQIRSTPDIPVLYSGNDPHLQLWVAVCLVHFFTDQYELLYGPLPQADRERMHAHGARPATTLNVRPDAWPATPEALEEYYRAGLAAAVIDPPVRQYLQELSDLRFLIHRLGPLGRLTHLLGGKTMVFFTRAGLPAELREQMGWEWTAADQRLFDRLAPVFRLADRIVPAAYAKMLWGVLIGMRLRRRLGMTVY